MSIFSRWSGSNGIGLRVADIRVDIARDLGINVSESTIRAVLKGPLRQSRTKGDSRSFRRWTSESIEYEKIYCTWSFNTFVITNQQYRLRFLDETGRESGETSGGYLWAPRGQPNRCAGPGQTSQRLNIVGMMSCAPERHHLLPPSSRAHSTANASRRSCWTGSQVAASCRATCS